MLVKLTVFDIAISRLMGHFPPNNLRELITLLAERAGIEPA